MYISPTYRRVAHHEAGHAAAYLSAAFEIDGIAVGRRGLRRMFGDGSHESTQWMGYCGNPRETLADLQRPLHWRLSITGALAGHAAEAHYDELRAKRFCFHPPGGDWNYYIENLCSRRDDWGQAVYRAEAFLNLFEKWRAEHTREERIGRVIHLVEAGMTDAYALVVRHWSVIEALATSLMEREFLSGEEAARVFHSPTRV